MQMLRNWSSSIIRHRSIVYLALFLCLGSAAGAAFAVQNGNTYFELIRRAAASSAYFLGLATSVAFPFVFALFFKKPAVYPIVFTKAFSLAAVSVGLEGAFGSAAWLVRLFFQFSDMLTVPVLVWFCINRLTNRKLSVRLKCLLATWYLLVISLDYFVVSRYLANLIEI